MEINPDNQAIEDKDRDVVKRFRSMVYGKELRRQKKSRAKIFAGIVIVCCAAAALTVKSAPWRAHPVLVNTAKDHEEVLRTDGKAQNQPSGKDQPALKQAQMPESNLDKKESSSPVSGKKVQMITKAPQYEKNKKEIAKYKVVMAAGEKTPSKSVNQMSDAGGISVAKIIACRSVADRRNISPQKEFSVKKDGKVYVWMDVRSKEVPFTVRHVYFINSRRYCSIPLSIKCCQIRTWSNISLNNPDDEGIWRVDVVTDKDEILSRIEFTVVP